MKRTLIDNKKKFFKANLHCHSNISDGKMTPIELKKMYQEHGYSIVAFSDHELFLTHNDLTDDQFLAINATELSVNDEQIRQTVHMNLFARRDDIERHPLWNREKYLFGNCPAHKQDQKFDPSIPDYERSFSPKCINEMVRIAKKAGFLVSLNHIEWSLDDFQNFSRYKGFHCCEVFNGASSIIGLDEDDTYLYHFYLKQGKRMCCVVGDDNHNWQPADGPRWDSFLSFTMFNAPKLNYKAILNAFAKGKFYCSTGPEITSLTFDPETRAVHVECSGCDKIALLVDNRANQSVLAQKGSKVTSADFVLSEQTKFFHLKLHNGDQKAWTNGYFVEDF